MPLWRPISKEKDMDEFNKGDLVEAVNGETVIRGRMQEIGGELLLPLTLAMRSDIAHLTANGFTLSTIEKALPPLPTEPGIYAGKSGSIWELGGSGGWWCLSNPMTQPVADGAPFTRLAPVAEVLGKMLAEPIGVRRTPESTTYTLDSRILANVAAEYGVTL